MSEPESVRLAISAYRLACKYRKRVQEQWEPRLPELRQLDAFHRSCVAYENADTRADWLCEETAHVLLSAVGGREPIPPEPFKLEVFEKCRNRLWLKAVATYTAAYQATRGQEQA
jgi:hypothetical protein